MSSGPAGVAHLNWPSPPVYSLEHCAQSKRTVQLLLCLHLRRTHNTVSTLVHFALVVALAPINNCTPNFLSLSQEGGKDGAELFFIFPFFLDGPPLTMPEESDEFIVVTGVVAGKVFF